MEAPFFLLAMPQLEDPLFHRSVVLIARHNSEGAFGLVLNKTLVGEDNNLAQMVAEIKDTDGNTLCEFEESLYFGGPANDETLYSLHSIAVAGDEESYIAPDLYLASRAETFQQILEHDEYKEKRRFFMGCSAWDPGQLESELRTGAWYTVPYVQNAQNIFPDLLSGEGENKGDQYWFDMLSSAGVNPLTLMGQNEEDTGYN